MPQSMFGHKCKYNRGWVGQGTWVFSMVERGTGRALAFHIPNRTRQTLETGLVQKFVEPGTTVISLHRRPLKHDRRCMESNQEKAEGDEWDSEEQTSKLPQRVQLAEILPW